jgi:pyruvate kinase
MHCFIRLFNLRSKVGEPILLDDGLIRLVVVEKKPNEVICNIEQGFFFFI